MSRARGPAWAVVGALLTTAPDRGDQRVSLAQSEQMAEALRRHGKPVRLVVLPDEGHRWDYGHWRSALRHYGEVERFLDGCLGGEGGLRPARWCRAG